MKKWVLLFLFLPSLWSCVMSGVTVDNQNYSLGDLRKAIVFNIGEPRKISENQRTFYSDYFSLKADRKFDPQKSKQRAYAKVIVLGDRRPYDLSITVVVEERTPNGEYSEVGEDPGQAQQLAQAIRKKLHQSIDDRNVIDDFRAF